MKVKIRMPRQLYIRIIRDLERVHPHAAERVGFVFARSAKTDECHQILLPYFYQGVPDDRYVRDDFSGARIEGDQIRQVMQHILSTGDSAFHVHVHSHRGMPRFSKTDIAELPRLPKCFHFMEQGRFHGLMLLSQDSITASVWNDGEPLAPSSIAITLVGFPTSLNGGISCGQ